MNDDEFDRLWRSLVARANDEKSKPLTKQERRFYAVNLLRGDVPSSGFLGYFENWTGADILDAHHGLKELELQGALSLLQEAQGIVLSDRPVPNDSSLIEVYPESMTEEEQDEASDQIDRALKPVEEKFFDCENEIWQALCRYADEHHLRADD